MVHNRSKICGRGLSGNQVGTQMRQRRSRLYTIAALPCQPEKPAGPRILADHKSAIGGKAAQAGPAVIDSPHLDIQGFAHPINRDGQIEFLGLRVTGRRRGFVGK